MKHIGFCVSENLKNMNGRFVKGLSYIVDNDSTKWNTKAFGIDVYSPNTLLNEDKENIRVFILSDVERTYNNISMQLREMGFLEGTHFIPAGSWNGDHELPGAYSNADSIKIREPGVIEISRPEIIRHNGRSRLSCEIMDGIKPTELWLEVDDEYAEYLCYERSDSFVVGLLSYAMRNGKDIKCAAPVTEELLYNLETVLIPTLVKNNSKFFYHTKIYADMASESLPCAGGVGTGISCGVDSFHAIYNFIDPKYKGMKLTHLCINNTGAFYKGYSDAGVDYVRKNSYERSRKAAKELGLPLIETDSNIQYGFPISETNIVHPFSNAFVVLALKKLWKTYYYASDYDFSKFSLQHAYRGNNALFDLLTFNCVSRSDIRICSEGGEKSRFEKLKSIADYNIAQKHLKVCRTQSENCGVCDKCRCTLLALDALHKLDGFKDAFDIVYYRKHRMDYLEWMCIRMELGGERAYYYKPIYESMMQDPETVQILKAIEKELSRKTSLTEWRRLKLEKDKWQKYTKYFKCLLTNKNSKDNMIKYLTSHKFKKIAFYKDNQITQVLCTILKDADIEIAYIVDDTVYHDSVPHYPNNLVEYPIVDVIFIANVDFPETIINKLIKRVPFPVLTIEDLIGGAK